MFISLEPAKLPYSFVILVFIRATGGTGIYANSIALVGGDIFLHNPLPSVPEVILTLTYI